MNRALILNINDVFARLQLAEYVRSNEIN